jgi:hypothetical protein
MGSLTGSLYFQSVTMLRTAAAGPAICCHDGRRVAGAGVAELADALDLGSSDENRGGSNPPARTSAGSDDRRPSE